MKLPKLEYQYCLLGSLMGILLGSIALASVLPMYIKTRACTTRSTQTTTSTTTTSTTSTTSTTTTSTTSTTSTTTTTSQPIPAPQPYFCSGVSSNLLWLLYGASGMSMDVDTSSCSFNSTPMYFTSITGDTSHWILTGYNAIYSGSSTQFRVYAKSLDGDSGTALVSYAQSYSWNLNWVGITY